MPERGRILPALESRPASNYPRDGRVLQKDIQVDPSLGRYFVR